MARKSRLTRRQWALAVAGGACAACLADGFFIEPEWIAVRRLTLADGPGARRLAHITDLHYKGARRRLERVVRLVNEAAPDFVCFTGDLVEHARWLPEALEILSAVRAPLYGVPGNHEYWSGVSFDDIARAFAATGGRWLMDERAETAVGLAIYGAADQRPAFEIDPSDTARIALVHYPVAADALTPGAFSLILAGHSHGGQIRLPFLGAPVLPYGVGRYDRGLFQTPAGPLYVNPGIGTYAIPARFFCRPEVTIVEV